MFIRSSTAINDCLIALDGISGFEKTKNESRIYISFKLNNYARDYSYIYESQEARDKAFEELCAFLNSNYKLRDFT
jgi:hypothetical protein